MGFLRQERWSGLPFPPPGDLPNPGIKPISLVSSSLAGFFTVENSYIRKFDNLYEMDKLLRRHKLPKRNQEEMENLNKSTILKKNQLVIKIPGRGGKA